MVLEINIGSCFKGEDVFKKMAHVLNFPDYAGMNWDALDDILKTAIDLSGTKLVFSDHQKFKSGDPSMFDSLINILDDVKGYYAGRGFDYEFQE